MRHVELLAKLALTLSIAGGLIYLYYAWPSDFPGCASTKVTDAQKLAIAELTDIVKWIFGLSVGMIGLYGSIMLRMKDGPSLTRGGKMLVMTSIVCFSFAAYFAVIWRRLLSQALYVDCPSLIAQPWMARSFDAQTYFFVAGIAVIGFMVALVALDGND